MAVKADVLDGDEGLLYMVRYLVVGYEGPSFIVELGKDPAVIRIYLCGFNRDIFFNGVDSGQI